MDSTHPRPWGYSLSDALDHYYRKVTATAKTNRERVKARAVLAYGSELLAFVESKAANGDAAAARLLEKIDA